MQKADLFIAQNRNDFTIKVTGRANFECGVPLRNFSKEMTNKIGSISIDLKNCLSMDSTFMGILSMIGLKAKSFGSTVEILNASESNRALLRGLGIEKLFTFAERETTVDATWQQAQNIDIGGDKLATAKTVVDAHKILMDADSDNKTKFEKVVEFAEQDLKKLQTINSENK